MLKMREPLYKRTEDVLRMFSISRTQLYEYAKDPDFPKPLKPSPKVTLWSVYEIEEFFKRKTIQNKS
jgi:predicted DNA-binding transcriptional regulator AlpA